MVVAVGGGGVVGIGLVAGVGVGVDLSRVFIASV